MTLTAILPNLYQLRLPTPFPVGPVNVYLALPSAAQDAPLTLIDVGPRTPDAQAALTAGLQQLGYTSSDIGRILITHAHSDHYGLAGELAQVSKATVYAHPLNRPLLSGTDDVWQRRIAFYEGLLDEAGVPRALRGRTSQMLQGMRRLVAPISQISALDEGDVLTLAGQQWQVLFMPGHASGLLCFYQPESRVLLSNDHLLRDISSNPFIDPPPPGQSQEWRSLVDYVASLKRTAVLDVDVAWPGHGEPIYDHRALIQRRLDAHQQRAQKVFAALTDHPQTVYALSLTLFPELGLMDRFMALSEVLAHLGWLEVQGRVVAQPQDGPTLWHVAACPQDSAQSRYHTFA